MPKIWRYRGAHDVIRTIEILQDFGNRFEWGSSQVYQETECRRLIDTQGQYLAQRTLVLRPAHKAWPFLWRSLVPRIGQFSGTPTVGAVESDEYLLRLCMTLELRATNDTVFHGPVSLAEDLRFEVVRYFGDLVASRLLDELDE